MFIQLIILACLADGATCRDFAFMYDAREISLLTCMTGANLMWRAGKPDIPNGDCGNGAARFSIRQRRNSDN